MSGTEGVPRAPEPHGPPVCVITGATSGIGRAAASELVRRGVRVSIVARDRERGEATCREIELRTGREVGLFVADLRSLARIRALAGEIREGLERLDILIHNAGVIARQRRTTEDGFEVQFAVNHLAPFLLTNLLLDLLRESAPSRVVMVSSDAHYRATLDLEDLQTERAYTPLRAYGRSKLANVLFTRELARRLAGTGVEAHALHPGVIATKLLYAAFPPMRVLGPVLKQPADGARAVVYVATAAELRGTSGRYFRGLREAQPSPEARDRELARRLWELSEELTGLR